MTKIQNFIVGCGLSGAVLARKLADNEQSVVIIDTKNHIGGNLYDYRDAIGVMVHKYGPHIFHTNSKKVWDFLSRFTKWRSYFHKVQAMVDGQFIPVPFNLNSLRMIFPHVMANRIEQKLLEEFGFNKKIAILELRKKADKDLQFLAQYIYEKIFLEYTMKQWEQMPDEIDPNVSSRVPIYISGDNRYFQDKYQGIPLNGYTEMIKNILAHQNIEVRLDTKFDKSLEYENLYWTGSIDEFFDYKFGTLPYRSVQFDFLTLNQPQFQEVSQVNYPCNYDFTRITEYKHFLHDNTDKTTVSYEYPKAFEKGKNDRQYPIVNDDNAALYVKYLLLAKETPNVRFFGRLGDYKYYDMWAAVERSLQIYEEIALFRNFTCPNNNH